MTIIFNYLLLKVVNYFVCYPMRMNQADEKTAKQRGFSILSFPEIKNIVIENDNKINERIPRLNWFKEQFE